MIDTLQNLAFAKPDNFLSFIKTLIDQRGLAFTYVLLLLVNK